MRWTSCLLVCAALASALLTGCDAGEVLDPEDSGAGPTATETSDAAELESALAIGETFEGAASTTVKAIFRGEGAEEWLPAGANFEWVAATVRTCVSAGGSGTEIGWYQWAATGADGGWYPADLDYDRDLPTGQYPRLTELAPGECAEGRILIAVPRDAELVTLVNSDQAGVPQGSWLIGDIGVPAAIGGE
ncbi:hypothetical protein [Nocardioides bizhenqiangii]|uniref:DUF4352 domain-containing protein n=1 Tax=Nocardioides bizhenqiangii TaxID=3095076 RepID=A0ABZ0ZP94_9ACTN|nr:hypothetical protein [Nocardioides sp. HM61]WQQ25639.1 hypothetical protein SHK19_16930 [Nocardioides sp. HM61]